MRENQSSLWSPNEEIKKNSKLENFCKYLDKKTLYKYCMQIPNAEQIIERMVNIDKQNKSEEKVEPKE